MKKDRKAKCFERADMDKNKELAKNTAIISIGKICTQFLGFFLLPLYTAVLSTEEYGTVDLLSTYQQLIGYIAFFQIEQAIFRFLIEVRDSEKKQKSLISSALIFSIFQTVVLGFLLYIFYLITGYHYTGYLFAYVAAVVFSGFMLQTARGLGKNSLYALGSVISASATIFCNILFLVVFHLGAQGMLLAFVVGNTVCAVFLFFSLKLYLRIDFKEGSIRQIKRCLKYSLPLVPNALSWWIMGASDRTIVSFVMGTSYNGLLSVAHKFSSAFNSFYTIFNLSWTESAALHINDDDHEEFFRSVIFRVYRLFAAATIGIIACMPFVFPILINKSYWNAYFQIPIYMTASLFNVIQGLYSVIYVGLKKTKEIAKTTVVSAFINVAVNLALIKIIGLYAASVSSLAAYAVNTVWRYFDLKKYMDIKFEKKLFLTSMLSLIVVCIGYYSQHTVLQIVCLTYAVGYCVFINREMIRIILKSPGGLKERLVKKQQK